MVMSSATCSHDARRADNGATRERSAFIHPMTPRAFILAAVRCLLLFAAARVVSGEEIAASEKAKIEALISHIETLKGATFVRNGSGYDAKTAGTFLRGKWRANEKAIKTAADFISKAATKSSTTGVPYVIRINGVETPCAEYLNAQLKKLGPAASGN
jgi:hypothetical protein